MNTYIRFKTTAKVNNEKYVKICGSHYHAKFIKTKLTFTSYINYTVITGLINHKEQVVWIRGDYHNFLNELCVITIINNYLHPDIICSV